MKPTIDFTRILKMENITADKIEQIESMWLVCIEYNHRPTAFFSDHAQNYETSNEDWVYGF